MDLGETLHQLQLAREVLDKKGAPIEGTAAGHLLLALEALVVNLDNSLGYAHKAQRSGHYADAAGELRRAQCTRCDVPQACSFIGDCAKAN